MTDKIKVLVVPSDRQGVGYFRSIKPHVHMRENYADLFDIDIEFDPSLADGNDEWLKNYDIIHYHKFLGEAEKMPALLEKLDKAGVVAIMDLDDHWMLPAHHPNKLTHKVHGIEKQSLHNIKMAKHIMTTTSLFADEIRKHNKNVYVVPNAIDPNEMQFKPQRHEPSDRIRIGWLGGSSHLKDLEIFKGLMGRFKNDGLLDKMQFVLCGFNIEGYANFINKKTGETKTRTIKPTESQWYEYEKIITDDYKIVSKQYKDFLLSFSKQDYPHVAHEPYRRVWSLPVTHYALNYRWFDIALAPLYEDMFNRCKSQLKILEAGFHKKALIAQDFGPYQLDLVNAYESQGEWNHQGNAILIDSQKNNKDWYKFIKRLIEAPELIKQLSENLYETVKDSYSLSKVTEERKNLYLRLVES